MFKVMEDAMVASLSHWSRNFSPNHPPCTPSSTRHDQPAVIHVQLVHPADEKPHQPAAAHDQTVNPVDGEPLHDQAVHREHLMYLC